METKNQPIVSTYIHVPLNARISHAVDASSFGVSATIRVGDHGENDAILFLRTPEQLDSVGICLIGRHGLYTVAQMRAAVHLVRSLLQTHGLSWSAVFGHYQHPNASKTCPDFQIDHFRSLLRSA